MFPRGTAGELHVIHVAPHFCCGRRCRCYLKQAGFTFSATASEARPTIFCDRVQGLRISGMSTTPIAGTQPIFKLIDSKGAWMSNSAAPSGVDTLVEVAGSDSADVLVSECDLREAQQVVNTTHGAAEHAVRAEGNVH